MKATVSKLWRRDTEGLSSASKLTNASDSYADDYWFVVENAGMKPRRDYDDYSKYINEAHMSRK